MSSSNSRLSATQLLFFFETIPSTGGLHPEPL